MQGQVLGGGIVGFGGGSGWQFMKTGGFLTRGFAISVMEPSPGFRQSSYPAEVRK